MTDTDDKDKKSSPETQTLQPSTHSDPATVNAIENSEGASEALSEASDLLSDAADKINGDDIDGAQSDINQATALIGNVLDYVEEQTDKADSEDDHSIEE